MRSAGTYALAPSFWLGGFELMTLGWLRTCQGSQAMSGSVGPPAQKASMVTDIDRSALLELIDAGDVQIVDVLPEAEYLDGHIPGAVNIPLKSLDENTARVLDRGKPVVVY